jgi:asparagine synthase (glutamine-hydrolysing)
MCGIAGVLTAINQKPDPELLAQMNDALYHRGPDGSGYYITQGVGFGHRRLSIIDLAGGHQPMTSDDDLVTITYNGEIYNFPELREELKVLGYHFNTVSDTEVILKAYHAWGAASVKRFRGMFVFAIHDKRTDEVFIVRDRLGIKPLFYAKLDDQTVVFASEIKSVKLHPKFKNALRSESVEEYFALGYVPEPHSIYKDIYKLDAGHHMMIDLKTKKITIEQYWDVKFTGDYTGSYEDAVEELKERTREAIKIRMVADVEPGAFLSGGVDSSAVVADMADISDKPVKTCSIGFDDPAYDETKYADWVADKYQTDHQKKMIDPNDFELIDQLMDYYDEPYADSSALPTFRVCELAKNKVTVALSGDGADENLAGYRRYKMHMMEEKMRQFLPASLRNRVFGALGAVYPKLDWAPQFMRAKTTFQGIARTATESYFHGVSIFKGDMRNQLFNQGFKNELNGYNALSVFERHAANAGTDDALSLIQYLDLKTYMLGDILTKVDRASMANSLEVRVPLIDHELIEWCARLPSDFKLKAGNGKRIFKKSLEGRVSDDILYRKKMGFRLPIDKWFRGPLKERVKRDVLSDQMMDSGYFNPDYLRKLVKDHQSGLRDHSAPLWTLMMFGQFMKRHVG